MSNAAINHVVATDGVRLAYRVEGPPEAPWLVLLNSVGLDLRMWEPQASHFSEHFRVLRFDTRGHGASDAPPEPYRIDRLGLDLIGLLDALDIRRAHLCGLSLGGLVAQWVAAEWPERVDRIVLANTAARISTESSWSERIAAVRSGGMWAVRDLALGRFLSERFRSEYPDRTQQIADIFEATPADGYIAACAALRDADLHSALMRIEAPVLIIAGDLDEVTPVPLARELHSAIADSRLTVLQYAAHLSNVEQSEVFNDHVLSFISRS
jgi:3-oxoadipate enol-lactonase